MNTNNFIQLRTKSSCTQNILKFAEFNKTWVHKNAFDLVVVPSTIVYKDSVIRKIIDEFKATPIIFKMQPWQFYRFHIDEARNCALNLFLSGSDSQTYYGSSSEDVEVMNITELNYEQDSYYLLNTKHKHAVINRNNIRYMFSLGIGIAEYETVRNFCLENNL